MKHAVVMASATTQRTTIRKPERFMSSVRGFSPCSNPKLLCSLLATRHAIERLRVHDDVHMMMVKAHASASERRSTMPRIALRR